MITRGPDRRVQQRRAGWLVQDWRRAYKWMSVQFAAVLGILQGGYQLLPMARDYVPPHVFYWGMCACTFAWILARLKAQNGKPQTPDGNS